VQPLVPPPLVRHIADAVHAAGGRVLLVGGSVRDHLLGRPVKDWDLEAHGLALDDLEQALRRVGPVSTVGRAFSVLKVHDPDTEVDISLPRRDSKVGPGHRGIRAEGDPHLGIEEAARRRDLTVNALMLDVRTGELLDPWGGLADLRAGLLRAVDADTFLEDPLRALRAVQFAARLDFDVDPELVALCRTARLDELAHERILGEWAKLLLRGIRPSRGLALARSAELLQRLFPEHPHPPEVDVALDRTVPHRRALDPSGRRLALMVAVWLHPLTPADAEATLDRLHLHRHDGFRTRDVALAAHAAQHRDTRTDADLRHLAAVCEAEVAVRARAAWADTDPSDVVARLTALGLQTDRPAPVLLGRHLKRLGRPGPWMGEVLDAVYTAQLDGRVTTRDEALDLARALVADT